MASREHSQVWLNFSKLDDHNAKCQSGYSNTSNLRKRLVKHKVYLKAEEHTVFDNLKVKSPAAGAASGSSTPAAGAVEIEPSMDDKLKWGHWQLNLD